MSEDQAKAAPPDEVPEVAVECHQADLVIDTALRDEQLDQHDRRVTGLPVAKCHVHGL